MSAPECTKPGATWSTCLAYMADGWISPSDLCPACTAAFMAALDGIASPLAWPPWLPRACCGSPRGLDSRQCAREADRERHRVDDPAFDQR